jgi:hypothetical protein
LSKLARTIDALADKDEAQLARVRKVAELRREAAAQLYATCASFVGGLNALLSRTRISLDPPEYHRGSFREEEPNLMQINVRGRLLQIEFRATDELTSTEEFRIPYVLEGSIRSFNQQLLDQDLMREHALFYCLEGGRSYWRYFDERTYRSGPVNEEYLTGLLEELI